MTSDVCVAMELIGKNAVSRWRQLMGPTNTQKAQAEAPESIRAKFGTDGTKNACHGSDSSQSAARELALFFGPTPHPTTAIFNNCICFFCFFIVFELLLWFPGFPGFRPGWPPGWTAAEPMLANPMAFSFPGFPRQPMLFHGLFPK